MSKREILKEIKRDLDKKADYITFKYETVQEIYELLTKIQSKSKEANLK